MKTTLTTLKVPTMMTFLGLSALIAHAQPDLGAAKGNNPPNRTPREMVRNMAPEQRRALMQGRIAEQLQERRSEVLRQALTQGGFDDKATQDAIIEFSNEQIKAALSIRDKTSKVSEALADKATTDGQFSVLLNDLHTAQTDEKERRGAGEKALDAKINYTQKPRLEALLTTLNLIGESSGFNIMGTMGGGRGTMTFGGAGAFGGRRGFDRGAFGANQNNAGQNAGGNAQGNPQGNDVFGLRRERGLRRQQREGLNDNANKGKAAPTPEAKPEPKPEVKPEAKDAA